MKRDERGLSIAPLTAADWQRIAPQLNDQLHANLPPDELQRLQAAFDHPGPEAVWGGYRAGELVGLIRVQILPGRSAVIAAPRMLTDASTDTAVSFLEAVLHALKTHDVQVVQALVKDVHSAEAQLLTAAGFQHAADLEYLVSLANVFPASPPTGELKFRAYTEHEHAHFAALVERTYVDSQDCPAAAGLRAIDDVLAGYRGSAVFESAKENPAQWSAQGNPAQWSAQGNPAQWIIASNDGADVGCLIIADEPDHNQSELMYIGVVPEARSRGLGLSLVRYAQWMTRTAGRSRLVLAVDAANDPAIAMYTAAGFITWDRQSVLLRAL
jgi:ribosomal protein S18 acetylase RimI-like enzyme